MSRQRFIPGVSSSSQVSAETFPVTSVGLQFITPSAGLGFIRWDGGCWVMEGRGRGSCHGCLLNKWEMISKRKL